MNAITDRGIEEEHEVIDQSIVPLTCPERENAAEKPAPHMSLKPLDVFPSSESDNSRALDLLSLPSATPDKALAAGVLKQAASDLRRYRTVINGVGPELYRDAYTWIHENDFSWPYSFVNVCNLLDLCPENVRTEVLADASLSWANYWRRRAGRVFDRLRSFLRAY